MIYSRLRLARIFSGKMASFLPALMTANHKTSGKYLDEIFGEKFRCPVSMGEKEKGGNDLSTRQRNRLFRGCTRNLQSAFRGDSQAKMKKFMTKKYGENT
jgi:hypothetical protein